MFGSAVVGGTFEYCAWGLVAADGTLPPHATVLGRFFGGGTVPVFLGVGEAVALGEGVRLLDEVALIATFPCPPIAIPTMSATATARTAPPMTIERFRLYLS